VSKYLQSPLTQPNSYEKIWALLWGQVYKLILGEKMAPNSRAGEDAEAALREFNDLPLAEQSQRASFHSTIEQYVQEWGNQDPRTSQARALLSEEGETAALRRKLTRIVSKKTD